MLRNLLFVICLSQAFHLSAMDTSVEDEMSKTSVQEDIDGISTSKDAELSNGITVEQAIELQIANQKIAQGAKNAAPRVIGGAALVTLLFPGFFPGILASTIGCPSDGLLSVWCLTGLAMHSVPVLVGLVAAASVPFSYCYHWWAGKKNAELKRRIGLNFTKGRELTDIATEQDMRIIGPILLEAYFDTGCCKQNPNRANLLTSLSPEQALIVAEIDFNSFTRLVEQSLNEPAKLLAQKLILLCRKDAAELTEALFDADVQELFNTHPLLWQTLLRLLPTDTFNDVQSGLRSSLLGIADRNGVKMAFDDLDKTIRQIAQGKPLSSFLLTDVSVETDSKAANEKENEKEIVLKTSTGQLTAKAGRLIRASEYFKGALSNSWASTTIDLTKENPSWVLAVVKAANKEQIEITEDNFWSTLQAARYFHVDTLIKKCDRFLRDFGLEKEILKSWWDDDLSQENESKNIKFDDQSFFIRWKLCKKFDLTETKHRLAGEFLRQLSELNIDDAKSLTEARLLSQADFDDAQDSFDIHKFNKKLSDSQFLRYMWKSVQEIDYLRQLVLHFCAMPQNKDLVERTWLPIPPAIKETMAKGISPPVMRNV